jgi:hypothetical protein
MKKYLVQFLIWLCVALQANASINTDSLVVKSIYYYTGPYMFKLNTIFGTDTSTTIHLYPKNFYPGTSFIDSLINNHYGAIPIETFNLHNGKVLSGSISEFYPSPKGLKYKEWILESHDFDLLQSQKEGWGDDFQIPLGFRTKTIYHLYDEKGNLQQGAAVGGAPSSVIYGYNNDYVIAEIANASIADIAYTSFEKRANGNWQFNGEGVPDETSPMGMQCYALSNGSLTKSGLSTDKTYQLSYWQKNGATVNLSGVNILKTIIGRQVEGWTYIVKYVTTSGSVTLTGDGFIDEVRLHPKDAMMITKAYRPLFGQISQCDARGNTQYWEYDGLQRIKFEKDKDKNIINVYDYHNKN